MTAPELGGRTLRSPLFLVSGVRAAAPEAIRRLAADVPALGGITTKSIGLVPRRGYREPVLAEYAPGCFTNAVGLANPGVREFREELAACAPLPGGAFLLVSLFADGSQGHFTEEFATLARELEPWADGFELNLSCPHVAAGGALIGREPANVARSVAAVRSVTSRPVLVKLSPNFGNIAELARAARDAGAAGIAAINTVGPGLVTMPDTGTPVLSHGAGGLSGRGIRPVGVACVARIAAAVDLPIIATGGIETGDDLRAYRRAGAQLFGIGSALAGIPLRGLQEYLQALLDDLSRGTDLSRRFRRRELLMEYRRFRVRAVERPGPEVAAIVLDGELPCAPGQFGMVWLPGESGGNEKPFSFAGESPLVLAVKARGPFSRRLAALEPGAELWIRGPYGAAIPAPMGMNLLLVAGGTGAAPLVFHHRRRAAADRAAGRRHLIVLGAASAAELLFTEQLEDAPPHHAVIATDDGSRGFHGSVLAALEEVLRHEPDRLDAAEVVLCGPERMMAAGVAALRERLPAERILAVLEPYMKCGVGICGSCALEDGRNACVDGHLLRADELAGFTRFGKLRRGADGGLEEIR